MAITSIDISRMDSALKSPVPFRAKGFAPRRYWWTAAVFFIAVILGLELGSRAGWITPLAFPAPSAILTSLHKLTLSGAIPLHLAASLQRIIIGWTLGTALGISFGLAIGLFTWARSIGISVVAALFPIPKIAILPLLIIWFGIGEASKIWTIALGVFFTTVINTYTGIDNVPRNIVRMGQSFDMKYWSIVRKIIIPGAMPSILAGFRITLSVSIILLVAAEMIGARYGLGAFILEAGNLYRINDLLAGVLVLAMLGLLFSFCLSQIEQRVLGWR
ncbi:ABC transporter permease [Neorhizobium sp. DT-125]|uniref:ABC transporter permease n=1 Tax=Neorhizobium sp. DT-125 TaxID=3396163 RepID=UPI003F1C04C9